jgi:hypothetical protein
MKRIAKTFSPALSERLRYKNMPSSVRHEAHGQPCDCYIGVENVDMTLLWNTWSLSTPVSR